MAKLQKQTFLNKIDATITKVWSRQSIFAGLIVLFTLANVIGLSFLPQKAQAASGRWINIATLEVDGKRYQEDKIDNSWFFYLVDDPDGCKDVIDDLNYNPDNQNDGPYALPKDDEVKLQKKKQSPSGCTNDGGKETVTLSGNEAAKYSFNWLDQATIEIPGEGIRFQKDDKLGGVFVKVGDNQCKDTLQPTGSESLTMIVRVTAKKLDTSDVEYRTDLRKVYQGHTWVDRIDYDTKEGDGCIISDAITGLPIGQPENLNNPPSTGADSTTADKQAQDDCAGRGVLAWILCPAVELLSGAVNWLNTNLITPLLEIDPLKTGGDARNDLLYSGWKNMRNLANIFFVIVFLVIIFSQALSAGLDAYAIKKILPRLLIAAIAVQISFFIVGFFVDATNILGKGLGGLIEAPIDSGGLTLGDNNSPNIVQTAVGAGVAGGITVGYAILVGLAPLLMGMLLLLFTIVMVLVFRLTLIYALVLASPLAFVAWVLPNTEGLFKRWWSLLLKLLVMYPMIVGLFAAAKVFKELPQFINTPIVGDIAAIITQMAPLGLIPMTFKFAGGALGGIASGMSNFRAGILQPMRQRNSQAKAARRAELGAKTKRGDLFGRSTGLSRLGSNIGQAVSNPLSFIPGFTIPGTFGKVRYGGTRKGLAAIARSEAGQQQIRRLQAAGISKNQPLMHALVRHSGSAGELDKHADQLEADGDIGQANLIRTHRDTLASLGKDNATREAALGALTADGYVEKEDFQAIKKFAPTKADHQRIVYETKRNAKALRLEHYGWDVDDNNDLTYNIDTARNAMRTTSSSDKSRMKTIAFNGSADFEGVKLVGNGAEQFDKSTKMNISELTGYAYENVGRDFDTVEGQDGARANLYRGMNDDISTPYIDAEARGAMADVRDKLPISEAVKILSEEKFGRSRGLDLPPDQQEEPHQDQEPH